MPARPLLIGRNSDLVQISNNVGGLTQSLRCHEGVKYKVTRGIPHYEPVGRICGVWVDGKVNLSIRAAIHIRKCIGGRSERGRHLYRHGGKACRRNRTRKRILPDALFVRCAASSSYLGSRQIFIQRVDHEVVRRQGAGYGNGNNTSMILARRKRGAINTVEQGRSLGQIRIQDEDVAVCVCEVCLVDFARLPTVSRYGLFLWVHLSDPWADGRDRETILSVGVLRVSP